MLTNQPPAGHRRKSPEERTASRVANRLHSLRRTKHPHAPEHKITPPHNATQEAKPTDEKPTG